MLINKEKNFISVILYIHNCESEIMNTLSLLDGMLKENFEKYEIICVNDNSIDNTIELIKNYGKKTESIINIINMSIFQGIEMSMNAAIDLAIGDFIIEFDNIFIDYPIDTIIEVYNCSLTGYDIVCCSPETIKGIYSKVFYNMFNRNSYSKYNIRTDSFRVLSRRAINRVHSISKTIPYRKALYSNSGLKMKYILYKPNRQYDFNYSKETKSYRKLMAIDSLILFTDIAQKLSISLSIILFLFTFISGLYTLFIYLGRHTQVEGWTTIMLLLSGGFTGIFMIFTIVIKYLTLLVDLVFKRQKYLVESIEKVNKNV